MAREIKQDSAWDIYHKIA